MSSKVSDERLAELREKHLRDAARLSRHDVLADPHRELAALLAELQEHRAREAASSEGCKYADRYGACYCFDEVVEAGARALADWDGADWDRPEPEFDTHEVITKRAYRVGATAVLAAVLGSRDAGAPGDGSTT